MIHIVQCNALNRLPVREFFCCNALCQFFVRQLVDCCDEHAVHRFEQLEIGIPCRCRSFDRTSKPIASAQRKRSPFLAGQPAADGVLPVCAMNDDLPDVMPVRCRPPTDPVERQSAYRAAKVRSVPCLTAVGIFQHFDKNRCDVR